MKILIYSVNPQSPHLAVDIELASNLSAAGNNVTIARCTGQLRACVENPNHHILVCEACKSTYRKGLHAAGLGNIKVIAIPDRQSRYPQWPHPFMNIGDLKAFTYDGMDAGFSVASTLIGRFDKDHQFDAIAHQHEIIRELQMWLDVYEGMQTYLLQEKPDVVYFFNGRFSSIHPLQCLCIKLGIDYYTHERGGVMNRYILRKNATPHSISYAANELAELWENGPADKIQIGERFFTDRRNSVIQSWISFTDEQKKGMLPEGFDFSKRNIAIFNSTMEEYEGMKEWANPLYKDENEAIRAVLRSFLSKPEFVFYLRVHPNLKLLDNSQMREIYSMANEFPNLRLIRPESRF
ncbi:MAG TPA: hypothetical protein PKM91_08730, partial [Cyclobacteriaceae bacterium]|nr:hypothetical protein [Cyclobacteriaceae bacterium]